MAWVETRITRTSQPQDACGIDWTNPITRKLKHALSPAHGCDLVTGKPMVFIGAGVKSPGVFGVGSLGNNASLGYVSTGSFGPEVTILGVFNKVTRTAATNLVFGLGATTGNQLLGLQTTGTSSNRTLLRNTNGGAAAITTFSPGSDASGVPAVFSAVYTDNTAANSRLFFNGVLATFDPQGSAAGSNATFDTFAIGGVLRSSAVYGDTGNDGVLALAFNRALSDAENKSLYDNPWQIFEPEIVRIWVDDYVSAGGGATDASGNTPGLALSPISATGSGAATASAAIDSAALSPISATASAAAQATAAVADLTTSATSATANGQAQAAGSTAGLTTSPVAATAFTTAVGTALASPANVALTGAAGAAQGAASATAAADTVSLAAAAAIATNTADAQAVAAFAALLINPATGAAYGSAQATGSLPVMAAVPLGGTATGGAVTATKARPTADISNTGWAASTGADLFAMLNEETPDAASYIQSTTVGASALVDLGAVGYPGSAAQRLSFSGSSSTGNGIRVSLINKADAAVVRTVDQALTPTDTRYDVTLTAGEIAAITSGLLAVQLTAI